ncbi:MAG: DUF362 domain-containing protein [Candidatus Aminicenantales bacterium]
MAVSKVVMVKGKGVWLSDGDLDLQKLRRMYESGIQLLTGRQSFQEGLNALFSQRDRVGIKINTIGGRMLSTRPEVSLLLAQLLIEGRIQEKDIVIWDRTNQELKEAGYSLSLARSRLKVFGTDTAGAGYATDLVSHLNIGSLFSTIQSNFVTASVSLAIVKDHGLAGITAGMKNYFGAIHNPNKYHDSNCDPFIAELFDTRFVKEKHRLSVLDCLVVQYHRGPSYHARWAEKHEALLFSLDPVAADFTGWQIVENLRRKKGLPSLEEEKRPPLYLRTAEQMGLGKASPKDIQIVEEEI